MTIINSTFLDKFLQLRCFDLITLNLFIYNQIASHPFLSFPKMLLASPTTTTNLSQPPRQRIKAACKPAADWNPQSRAKRNFDPNHGSTSSSGKVAPIPMEVDLTVEDVEKDGLVSS